MPYEAPCDRRVSLRMELDACMGGGWEREYHEKDESSDRTQWEDQVNPDGSLNRALSRRFYPFVSVTLYHHVDEIRTAGAYPSDVCHVVCTRDFGSKHRACVFFHRAAALINTHTMWQDPSKSSDGCQPRLIENYEGQHSYEFISKCPVLRPFALKYKSICDKAGISSVNQSVATFEISSVLENAIRCVLDNTLWPWIDLARLAYRAAASEEYDLWEAEISMVEELRRRGLPTEAGTGWIYPPYKDRYCWPDDMDNVHEAYRGV